MGYEGQTASSTVPEEAVPRLRASGGKVKPGSMPVATTADPLPAPARRAPEAEPAEAPDGDGQVGASAPDVVQIPEAGESEGPQPGVAEIAEPPVRIPHGASPQDIAERLGISARSEEHTSELQSRFDLVCRLL